jgi:hypothetical protein
VHANRERFPGDFMFQLSAKEFENWRSQIVISKPGARMALRRPPFGFTEHGALMAATVLNSRRAVEMSLYIVRAFVRMREVLATHKALARKLAALERRVDSQNETIVEIVQAIRSLMAPPEPTKKRRIGFIQSD